MTAKVLPGFVTAQRGAVLAMTETGTSQLFKNDLPMSAY
jgi:hypothetical protein